MSIPFLGPEKIVGYTVGFPALIKHKPYVLWVASYKVLPVLNFTELPVRRAIFSQNICDLEAIHCKSRKDVSQKAY